MKRRRLLLGAGTLLGAGGTLGTGAFTSVSADRSVSVQVADDADAFLAMEPSSGPNGEYATADDGTIALEFADTDAGGRGLGTDSTYQFDDVFRITNQGTRPVYVRATFSFDGTGTSPVDLGGPNPDVYLYPNGDAADVLRGGDGALYLPVGGSAAVGLFVDTDGVETGTIDLTATIHATAERPGEGGVVGGGGTAIPGPTGGLAGYWPLDDRSGGTVADVVGANDGTVEDAVSIGPGQVGRAATFEGGYVEVGTKKTFGFPQFTVAAWAKVSDTDTGLRTVLARQNPTAPNPYQRRTFVLWFDDADEFFGAEVIATRTAESDGDLRDVTADGTYTDGEWHHLVATAASGGELALYVDGEPKGTRAIDGPLYTGPGQTWIGRSPGQDRPLNGAVDDVRIYDRVLSPAEVTALYEQTGGADGGGGS
jgi:hypothetical protein